MEPTTIQYLLIGILSFNFVFNKLLSGLNVTRNMPVVPSNLEGYVDAERLKKSRDYQIANFKFGLLTGTFSYLITLAVLVFGFFGWLDTELREFVNNPIGLSLFYFAVLYIGSDILGLPFDYYHTFVIEEKFGFNSSSKSTFFMDKLKGYLLSIVIGGSLLFVLLWLVHAMGADFWWQFWLVAALFMILANNFFASLILPLFNKLTPMEDGELKEKIMAYAKSVKFPLENVFVIDGSKRSKKANAFFSGFGKRKKVVLYDTLIQQHSQEELVAVLAHEVGHYKKKHIIQGMLLGLVQTGLILYVLSLLIFSEPLSLALGGQTMAVHLNLVGFTMLFSPLSGLIGIGMNLVSRRNEFEADDFAKYTYRAEPLAEALKNLSVNNLTQLDPHPWYVFVNYSHPPLLQRLANLEK